MLQTHTYVSAGCDRCAQAGWKHWDYPPEWPSEAAALAELTTRGWRITRRRLLCAPCAALLAEQPRLSRACLSGRRGPAYPVSPQESRERPGHRPVSGEGRGVA
jgi:hypothetical protein